MSVIDRIKGMFKKGSKPMQTRRLMTINDHEMIDIDPKELRRIEGDLRIYSNEYPMVKYHNAMGVEKQREYTSLNMMKLSANLMAGLVFNEQCEVVVSDAANEDDDATNTFESANDFIKHTFEHNDFYKNLSKYLEPMYALGGLAVRPYYDEDKGEIEFSWALADAFYPLRSNSNGISEGVMKSVTMKMIHGDPVYYTLLEFHTWEGSKYIVRNELYKSTDVSEIGEPVQLAELYGEDEISEETWYENFTRPQFNYVTPAGFNNLSPMSPLGLSIVDNSKSTLRKINDTYDQFWWEIKMGQRTVFVSDRMLNVRETENGRPPIQVFDPDNSVYKSISMNEDGEDIKDVTRDIRTEQYISAINQTLRTLEMELRLSVGTFSFDGRSMKTATEIVSENDLTFRTRNENVGEVERFIKGLVISILELAQEHGAFTGEIPTFEHIGVDFDDGVFQDRDALLKFYSQAKIMKLVPTVEIIQRVFNVPYKTALEWMEIIKQEELEADPMTQNAANEEKQFGVIE